MRITRVEQQRIDYQLDQIRPQEKRDDDYRKLVEKRKLDRIVVDRVARNIRLDLDKGRHVDIDC
jgi:hypothetical protein